MRYTPIAIALHWLIAAAILGAFCVGLYMADLPVSPSKLKIYSWHKWAGVSIFMLVLLRTAWRIGHPPPPAVPMPHWQALAAEAVHKALYLLMFAIPLSGWLMSSAKGYQTVYFGVLPIPDLLSKDVELGKQLAEVHEMLNFLMIALVAGHAAAAVKHHLIDRDDTLRRMLPWRSAAR